MMEIFLQTLGHDVSFSNQELPSPPSICPVHRIIFLNNLVCAGSHFILCYEPTFGH